MKPCSEGNLILNIFEHVCSFLCKRRLISWCMFARHFHSHSLRVFVCKRGSWLFNMFVWFCFVCNQPPHTDSCVGHICKCKVKHGTWYAWGKIARIAEPCRASVQRIRPPSSRVQRYIWRISFFEPARHPFTKANTRLVSDRVCIHISNLFGATVHISCERQITAPAVMQVADYYLRSDSRPRYLYNLAH